MGDITAQFPVQSYRNFHSVFKPTDLDAQTAVSEDVRLSHVSVDDAYTVQNKSFIKSDEQPELPVPQGDGKNIENMHKVVMRAAQDKNFLAVSVSFDNAMTSVGSVALNGELSETTSYEVNKQSLSEDKEIKEKDEHQFIDLMGMDIAQFLYALIRELIKTASDANKTAAKFAEISFNLAGMAGDNLVKAAHATLTGAIAGHAAGLTLQGVSTFRTVKALNNENRSLKNNVEVAQIKQEQLSRESLHVESASNNINNPEGLGRRPLAMMRDSHAEINRESQELMRLHEKVRNRTAEVDVIGSYTTQAGQATTGIIQAGAGTESASKNKQAELDKAGQQTSERTGDTHKQTATQSKEAAERLLALFEKRLAN